MLENFIKWLVPFLCGAGVAFAGSMLVRLKALKTGVQCLLRAEIIRAHDKYHERCYCPVYAKEALTKAYNAYHALGGNDVATNLYKEILQLPTEPLEERERNHK